MFNKIQKLMKEYYIYREKGNSLINKSASCLKYLNNAVVWMVSTRPLISGSSSSFTYPLVTVPNVPITIGITVFHFSSKV